MCGIYGSTIKYNDKVIKDKLLRVVFRGPDNVSFKRYNSDGNSVILGHNRLSIIDLDARSNQPFDYNDSLSIVFNGEIYNYRALSKDHLNDVKLKTNSDTEVICAMYEKYGVSCVKFFNGMFSFVILDKKAKILYGARDRLGKKPFYYYQSDKGFEFSSQLSQIQVGNDFTINSQARLFFLINGCIPDPLSIYNEVKKLSPGHYFVYNLEVKEFKDYEYWNLFCNSNQFDCPKTYKEAKEKVKELLDDAVSIRLNSDVPLGAFLSGGIDSSLISAIALKKRPELVLYNIGFKEKKYDESLYAQIIANSLNAELETTYCDTEEMFDMLSNYCYYWDEPFADVSLIPTSLVCKKAREHVTVVLGGDGGDESFYGYNSYRSFVLMHQAYRFPRIVKVAYHLFKPINSLRRFTNRMRFNDEYEAVLSGSRQYYGAERYSDIAVMKTAPHSELLNPMRGKYSISDYMIATYLNDDINTKADRAAMRFSLELRSPLMDYRLIEFSRLLPYDYLWDRKLGGKRILKDILSEYVPFKLFMRKKMGFSAPVEKWLRGELRDSFMESLSYDNVNAYIPELDPAKIGVLCKDFLNGKDVLPNSLWTVYSYIQWIKSVS
jgi:asparagine synthase (glutamine-hydrolysing)